MADFTHSEFLRDDPESVEIGSVINRTFELIKEHPAELIGLTFAGAVLVGIINMIAELASSAGNHVLFSVAQSIGDTATGVAILGMIGAGFVKMGMMTAVSALLTAALSIMWLRLIRGQAFSVEYLFEAKRFILPLLLIQFATQFAVIPGMMACIVPGMIIAFGLSLANIVAIDHGLKPMDALTASWELTSGRKLEVFILMLALGVLNICGLMACGVGMLVTIPMSMGGLCLFYNGIARAGNHYLTPNEHTGHQTPDNPGGW